MSNNVNTPYQHAEHIWVSPKFVAYWFIAFKMSSVYSELNSKRKSEFSKKIDTITNLWHQALNIVLWCSCLPVWTIHRQKKNWRKWNKQHLEGGDVKTTFEFLAFLWKHTSVRNNHIFQKRFSYSCRLHTLFQNIFS